MFYREVWLWYVIEMSSVCDSYWSRDYHDDTGSRVVRSTTWFVSELFRFPLGSEDWWAFEGPADAMEMAAAAISEDVSIEAVIGNVFADDKISRSSIFLETTFAVSARSFDRPFL